MDQNIIVRKLSQWLTVNKWHEQLSIKYDLASWGDPGESEQCPMYLGEKKRGSGRATRVCLPDILVTREDTRTIELIVEVDLTTNLVPKKLVGLLLTPALADYYTPSLQYGAHNSYRLRETVIVSVTALTAAQRGQDLAEAIYRKFRLCDLGVRHISVCNGATEGDIETKFARLIQTQFGITRARSE